MENKVSLKGELNNNVFKVYTYTLSYILNGFIVDDCLIQVTKYTKDFVELSVSYNDKTPFFIKDLVNKYKTQKFESFAKAKKQAFLISKEIKKIFEDSLKREVA